MVVEFSEPPETGRSGEARLTAMQENPGEWIVWARGVVAANVTKLNARHGAKGFEFVTRDNRGEGARFVCDIYARYVEPAKVAK